MTDPAPRPTLLVFTLGPAADCARRPLLPAALRPAEARLRERCLERALEAGRDAGCRLVVSSPERLELPADVEQVLQDGAGFGERLRRAGRAAGDGGPIVVVGSDVPGLAAEQVRRSLDLLASDPERVVLGPSPDGGVYLIASARPLDAELAGVSWCDAGTRADLVAALAAAGHRAVLLEPLGDLDRRSDLERWLARTRRRAEPAWARLVGLLAALLAELGRTLAAPAPPVATPLPARLPDGRAPPRRQRR